MTISTDEALKKLEELVEDYEDDPHSYNSFESDFLEDFADKLDALKEASGDLSITQRDKIEEIYINHFGDDSDENFSEPSGGHDEYGSL